VLVGHFLHASLEKVIFLDDVSDSLYQVYVIIIPLLRTKTCYRQPTSCEPEGRKGQVTASSSRAEERESGADGEAL
jgi:hypothetical protein